MLSADGQDGSVLDQPTSAFSPTSEDPEVVLGTIGAYRLLRQIGQGGMSTVYLAVRADDAFRHRVVIKVIRRGLESEAMIRRMEVERQILASLNHPNIARLFDGGATDDGLPYFVMEYIEGSTIDAHCAHNQLSVDGCIDLFLAVCDAVRHAHQNLVVHRDLKPANIMVTTDGQPKLLDFGIAKMLNPGLGLGSLDPTATRQSALTPNYASPEQIRGKQITTASDVYSLGVVLYRLLTGHLPYDFQGLSPSQVERLILASEPVKPSTRAGDGTGKAEPAADQRGNTDGETRSPRASRGTAPRKAGSDERRRRALAGDLDAIVLKTLRSTLGDRYSSVEQLSADLERYRQGRPVLARQGTWGYHARKFVHRHRAGVLAGSAIALLLAALVTTIVWHSVRVTRERDETRLEIDKKRQVQSLILEIFQHSHPYAELGSELTVHEALERSVPLLRSRLVNQPAVRAELLFTSGSILAELGKQVPARVEIEEALRLRRELHGDDHPEVLRTQNVLVFVLTEFEELDAAEALAQKTVAAARRLEDNDALLVESLTELAYVLCYRDRYRIAEPPAAEALTLAQAMPASTEREISPLEYLGRIRASQGQYQEAATLYRRAIALRRQHSGPEHPSQINALNNLGLVLRRQEAFDEAESAYQQMLDLQQKAFGDDYRDPITQINLAGVQMGRSNFHRAEAIYRTALADLGGPDSGHGMVLGLQLRIAAARIGQGAVVEVEGHLRGLIDTARASLGDDHWRVALGLSLLGASLSAQERFEEAEPLLVDSFHRLRAAAKARYVSDAFERLRAHLERAQKPDEIEGYRAFLDP